MMAEITITSENFEQEVIKSDKPVMIDFWATWCGPCKMIAPSIAAIAEEYEGKVKVCKINVDKEQALASAFQIDAIPTVVVMKDGQVTNMSVGFCSKDKLIELLK